MRELSSGDRDTMYRLFERYYADTDATRFGRDLDEKDDVIVLRDADGAVRGFSTLKQLVVVDGGVAHRGIYSGDTVVDSAVWGQGVLGRAFLGYLLRARMRHPFRPLWWFLISKGYKTYLLMANNFPEHWPRHEAETPSHAERLRAAFARRLFGADYQAASGVVRFSRPCGRVRDGMAPLDEELLLTNPRAAFFARSNPGWARGDELVCLARMTWSLPLTYAWKKARPGGAA